MPDDEEARSYEVVTTRIGVVYGSIAPTALNLALFDFDGTITTSDTWTPFLRFAIPPARLTLARVALTPVLVAYHLGLINAGRGRELATRVAFTGESAERVGRRGADYATHVLPAVVRADILDRIAWHKKQDDRVVVVSASLDAYLTPWCSAYGVDCICTTLEKREGRLTGRVVGGDCSGGEKVRRIRARYALDLYPVVYAYGDTDDDRDMLALAHRRYFRGHEVTAPL